MTVIGQHGGHWQISEMYQQLVPEKQILVPLRTCDIRFDSSRSAERHKREFVDREFAHRASMPQLVVDNGFIFRNPIDNS